jgi:conjugative transfer signal peptidase TraF
MKRQHRSFLGILACGVGFYAVIGATLFWGRYVWNFTDSYPIGLWKIETLTRPLTSGDVIVVCPPYDVAAQALEKSYSPTGLLGSVYCPTGVPFIKGVLATEGQRIQHTPQRLFIENSPVLFSQAAPHDGNGRELPQYKGGVVPKGCVFVHAYTGGSYDSRYFGPIPESGVLGLAKPVFVF